VTDDAAAGTAVEGETSRGAAPAAPATPKKKRGRETAGDMIRSLAVVLLLVFALWFLAQPPDSDEQPIRVVDATQEIDSFSADQPGTPVPAGLPAQWRSTSATVVGEPSALRVGYVTPSGRYAEYAASTAAREQYLPEITGEQTTRLEPVQVASGTWEQYRDGDGSLSLVRSYGDTVVIVGSLRATAPLDELETLAAALATR